MTLDVPRDALTATFVFVAGTVPGAGSVVVTGTGTGTGRVDIDVVGTEGIVIDLSGFKLVQTGGGTKTFVIPAGTQVPMGGTLLVTRKSEAAELASHFGIVLGPDVVVVNSKDTFLVINATPRQIELQRPDGTTLDGPSAPTANRKTLQRNVPFGPASDPASWTLSDDTASTRGTRTANAGSLAGCYISEVADVDAFASETIEISCEGPIAPP